MKYVDTEFTEIDVHREVQSPTDKSASRSKGFLSLVSSRTGRKMTPPVQDPTFKDFTYFCEDPDALVEVTNLVSELHPVVPPPPPPVEEAEPDVEESMAEQSGTPLTSFVENGYLDRKQSIPQEDLQKELKKLEATMTEQFERVEVTISRERPAQKSKSDSQENLNRSQVTTTPLRSPHSRAQDSSSTSSSTL